MKISEFRNFRRNFFVVFGFRVVQTELSEVRKKYSEQNKLGLDFFDWLSTNRSALPPLLTVAAHSVTGFGDLAPFLAFFGDPWALFSLDVFIVGRFGG